MSDTPAPAIATTGLTKRFGDFTAVDDLDLTVAPGEMFGFLGPNGSGKSTTIRMLLDQLRPTSGSANVLGRDSRADSLDIRRRIGYLPGDLACGNVAIVDGIDFGLAAVMVITTVVVSAVGFIGIRRRGDLRGRATASAVTPG